MKSDKYRQEESFRYNLKWINNPKNLAKLNDEAQFKQNIVDSQQFSNELKMKQAHYEMKSYQQ